MRSTTAFVAAMLLAVTAFADARRDVRDAELAFAKAFADRDQAKFFSFVLDDATFLGGGGTLRGKSAVVERWARFFAQPRAPFSWTPDRVAVNAAGTIGETAGGVYDIDGHPIGNFNSVWARQPDGSWKILFDGPGGAAACLPETAAPFAEGDVVTPDGAKLHYKKIGAGRTTLIVPLGFILYDDFKQLADVATVIAYDPRGRGRSSRDNAITPTIQQDVADFETVRAHFNVDKVVPVGFSYLGLMVAMFAIDHPEHVARLVQLGPISMTFGKEYPKELDHGDDDVHPPAADLQRFRDYRANPATATSPRDACEIVDKVTRYALVGDPAHASRIRSNCDFENEWPVNLDKHFDLSFASMKSVTITPAALAKITMPVLVIHGTFDRNVPYGSGREWAAALPSARLVTIPGAAHASWVDDPGTVFGAIREFLRGE